MTDLLNAIGLLLLALSLMCALPVVILFVQIMAALTLRHHTVVSSPTSRSARVAVLMPAHNEAKGISAAIAAVLPQLLSQDRLLVVVDNSSDDTASVARQTGAEVVEREDEQRRGKGYALDFGVRWLEQDPPDIVVVLDADCYLAPGSLSYLANQCQREYRPVQALYLMHAPRTAPMSLRIAEFAWLLKNKIRPLGCSVLGWPCQLMGSGMAFPWQIIKDAPLASGHLVEDLQLGVALSKNGLHPTFCPQATVESAFPSDISAVKSQRTRWEHGHISLLVSAGPRQLWRAFLRCDRKSAAMALDMMIPPLTALLFGSIVIAAISMAFSFVGGHNLPMWMSLASLMLFSLSIFFVWLVEGKDLIRYRELIALPGYVAAKVPLYMRLFMKRQIEWVRTKRDE